jgi:hypothetical protein
MTTEVRTQFKVEGLEHCKTGHIANFTLIAEDDSGQPKDVEMAHLKAWLKGGVDIDGRFRRVLQGQYNIEFQPQDPGHYWLDVQIDSQPIFQRDDVCIEVNNKSPRHRAKLGFMFEGDGFYSGRVGEPVEFRIIPKDDDDKKVDVDILALEVRIKGPANHNEKAALHRDQQGRYVARYTVNIPGDYVIHVHYDERPVANQTVHFSDASRGEKSVLLNLPSGNVRAKETTRIKIQSKDMFGNDVKTGGDQWQALSTGPSPANIQITDNLDGTYIGELTFPRAGVYHIEFKLLGVSASNSPVKFTAV